ncbi:MAG: c-type cytochrome [Terracidiphilus sp.]
MLRTIKRAALLVVVAMLAVPAFAQGTAPADYKAAKCAMCHAADGTGNKAMKVASFKEPDTVKATDAQLIALTTDGKGKMPAYKGKLTDAQIKDLVAYIRTLQK